MTHVTWASGSLTWGEPPDAVDANLRWMDGLATETGRTLCYGIRLHVVSRDIAAEAWRQAGRLIENVAPEVIRKVQEGLVRSESEGHVPPFASAKSRVADAVAAS